MKEVKDKIEIVEHYISRGSVPAVPRSVEVRKPGVIAKLKAIVTGNVIVSLASFAVILFHLGSLIIPGVQLAAVILHYHGRSQFNGITPSSSASTPFTPTHLFFMSTTGSDAAAGTSPATAWATPNHAISCGDVIIAQAGDYSSDFTTNGLTFGTIGSCPSSTAGTDGTGGVNFAILLCAGADLEACHTSGILWDVASNNWSVQGWKITFPNCTTATTCGSEGRGFNFDGCAGPVAFFAAINNVLYSVGSAVHTDDCAGTINPSAGADYTAAVGNIGVRASMNTICEAAFDMVGPWPHDQLAGTHYYLYNNYTWNNNLHLITTDCDIFDSESFMFDAWDAHPNNNNTGVIANNISWNAQRYCVQFFSNGSNTITPTMKAYNNTCYRNLQATASDSADGEVNVNVGHNWTMPVTNNILFSTPSTSPFGGNPIYAMVNGGGLNANSSFGSGATQNIFKGNATGCAGTCDSGNNVAVFNGNSVPGGIYVDPGFTNTADLLANRSGNIPNCSGFINTTACMGWNASTQVLTTPSVISDLQPNPNCGGVTGQCVGKGFQLPSTTCVSSGPIATDYPTFLKSIVYLHASGYTIGATITQNYDLATRKCGL